MFKPPLYLSIVVVEQHVSSGTSQLHTVPLKNQHFIMEVKRFTAAAQGQEIQTEREMERKKKERKKGGREQGREERKKENTSIIQMPPSKRSHNSGIAVGLSVI